MYAIQDDESALKSGTIATFILISLLLHIIAFLITSQWSGKNQPQLPKQETSLKVSLRAVPATKISLPPLKISDKAPQQTKKSNDTKVTPIEKIAIKTPKTNIRQESKKPPARVITTTHKTSPPSPWEISMIEPCSYQHKKTSIRNCADEKKSSLWQNGQSSRYNKYLVQAFKERHPSRMAQFRKDLARVEQLIRLQESIDEIDLSVESEAELIASEKIRVAQEIDVTLGKYKAVNLLDVLDSGISVIKEKIAE